MNGEQVWRAIMLKRGWELRRIIDDYVKNGGDIRFRVFTKTFLHEAINLGKNECIRQLVEHGIDVDSVDDGGMSPLHYAVDKGFHRATSILLELGANPLLKMDIRMSTRMYIGIDTAMDALAIARSHGPLWRSILQILEDHIAVNIDSKSATMQK